MGHSGLGGKPDIGIRPSQRPEENSGCRKRDPVDYLSSGTMPPHGAWEIQLGFGDARYGRQPLLERFVCNMTILSQAITERPAGAGSPRNHGSVCLSSELLDQNLKGQL